MKREITVLGIEVGFFLFRFLHTAASFVEDADAREEKNFFSECARTSTEIGVFVVEKKLFVETVNAEKKFSWNSESGAAYPRDPSQSLRFPEGGAFRDSKVIPEEVPEGDGSARTPWFREFRFEEEPHTNDAERRIVLEDCSDIAEISGEEAGVGIQKNKDAPPCFFCRSVRREAEAAIVGEREEREGKSRLKFSERGFFGRIVIRDDPFGIWKGDISKRRKTRREECGASVVDQEKRNVRRVFRM